MRRARQQKLREAGGPDERLETIFASVGERYGYSKVEARFVDFDEGPKVKYSRSGRKFKVKVSSYYETFPDEVLAKMADTIFHGIASGGWRVGSSEEYAVLEV